MTRRAGRRCTWCFNPKREVRPSQTMSRCGTRKGRAMFQSQTGSQALSDDLVFIAVALQVNRFNPKREVRPSQTCGGCLLAPRRLEFQSQTGSQALSDVISRSPANRPATSFNPKREVRPSQTGICDRHPQNGPIVSIPNGKSGPLRLLHRCYVHYDAEEVSIPNGKSGPLRHTPDWPPACWWCVSIPNGKSGPLRHSLTPRMISCPMQFQSQTGSQALSDVRHAHVALRLVMFQSQTGSQALSDDVWTLPGAQTGNSFNPKREVRPSQTLTVHLPRQNRPRCFNPKREVRPSQTWRVSPVRLR